MNDVAHVGVCPDAVRFSGPERGLAALQRFVHQPKSDDEYLAAWESLPPTVRRKGPPIFSPAGRCWIEDVWFIERKMAQLGMIPAYFVGSLTLDPKRTATALGKGAVQSWADRFARELGEHAMVVYALETTGAGEREIPAVVAVPRGGPQLTTKAVEGSWSLGHAHVRRFTPGVGGTAYVIKRGKWGVTFGCPRENACRRQSGCRWTGQRLDPPTT